VSAISFRRITEVLSYPGVLGEKLTDPFHFCKWNGIAMMNGDWLQLSTKSSGLR
jgi:hypothetical protein